MGRITISFTRYDKDIIDHIKEIPPNERSHEIVRALRQHWFVCENSVCTTPSSSPVEDQDTTRPPIDEDARREAQKILRERVGRNLRTQGVHTKDTRT